MTETNATPQPQTVPQPQTEVNSTPDVKTEFQQFKEGLLQEMSAFRQVIRESVPKLIAEETKKLLPAHKPSEESKALTPEAAKLQELQAQIAELTHKSKSDTLRATREGTLRVVSEALAAKGITGVKARAVTAFLQSEGVLSFDQETAAPKVTVTRQRNPQLPAAPVEFPDVAKGLEDWFSSDEAKAFIPAPKPLTPQRSPVASLLPPGKVASNIEEVISGVIQDLHKK